MFLKFIPILLLMCGCTNKLSTDETLKKAKETYDKADYTEASHILRELDAEAAWEENRSLEILTLLAKSTYLASKDRDKDKNLLESIQVCDTIIAHNPVYAIKNEVYLTKIRAYFDMVNFDKRRCDKMAYKMLEAAQEYLTAAKDNNLMEVYNKHKAEIRSNEDTCRAKITARAIAQSHLTSKPLASLAQLYAIENDPQHAKRTPELYYNQLIKLIELKKDHNTIYAVLGKIYISSKKDLKWLKMGIDAIEDNKIHYKFNPTQAKRLREYKKFIALSSYQ